MLIPRHELPSTSGGSRPLHSVARMIEARFHCSKGNFALFSDAPGIIEIVATLEMSFAISCKLAIVGNTVMISIERAELLSFDGNCYAHGPNFIGQCC
jgi:hypothetical protein